MYLPGTQRWNMKMLQCCKCNQWFHEACTQCLRKPLLYGDRFYLFECSVCTKGPESVWRLPLRWVDVAHLVVYHLSICCKKKYFDFEREILTFANENWENLLLGELSDTPRVERYNQLLSVLNNRKDRFISGKEIKKKKCLFGLHNRVPPPVPQHLEDASPESFITDDDGPEEFLPSPCRSSVSGQGVGTEHKQTKRRMKQRPAAQYMELRSRKEKLPQEKTITQQVVEDPASLNQSYKGYSGSYNFRRIGSRCLTSSPIKMFASFHPSANTTSSLPESFQSSEGPRRQDSPYPAPSSKTNVPKRTKRLSLPSTSRCDRRPVAHASSTSPDDSPACPSSSTSNQNSPASGYFGATGRLARGESVRILARRRTLDGTMQYLLEWEDGNVL